MIFSFCVSRPCSPVYENLPRRTSNTRWAYDSLRASHKFQWGSNKNTNTNNNPTNTNDRARTNRALQDVLSPKAGMDESLDETVNSTFSTSLATSLNTSLNTSVEAEVDAGFNFSKDSNSPSSKGLLHPSTQGGTIYNGIENNALLLNSGVPPLSNFADTNVKEVIDEASSRPAALTFWQELQTREQSGGAGDGSRSDSAGGSDHPTATTPSVELSDNESPFR